MPQTLFVTDGCLIDYEFPFVFRVTHLESARSANFLVHLNVQFPAQPERLSAIVVTQNPIQDQDGHFIEDEVATQMRVATMRSILEQGVEVDLLLYNPAKEIYQASRQSYLEGGEKEVCLNHLGFLDAVHRDQGIQRAVRDRNTWPTQLTELSDLWDDIAFNYGWWRGIRWPSPAPEKWMVPARYRAEPKNPDDLTFKLDSVTRVATGNEIFACQDPKRIIFNGRYPIEFDITLDEYHLESDRNSFSLYTRQQFGCRRTEGDVCAWQRPLHESLEMHDPVPAHVRQWVDANVRQAFPEYRISINWLNPDDRVPLYRIADTEFQVASDGVYEAPWGWRLRVERSTLPERPVNIECYDKQRKTYLILPYDSERKRTEIRIPNTWHNGDVVTDEQARHLETFLEWVCSEASVVRQADIDGR